YRIKDVLIDGKSQGILSSYIFTNVSCNHTISASFEGTSTGVAQINTENISDLGFELKLSCRSNPASDFTHINYFLPSNQEVTIGIYNINGQRIKQLIRETQNSGRHEVSCNVSGIPSGIYYVLLSAGNLRSTSKLIIAN
ncbi:MAG: T9SS type A sorting domain-containing protein, partial [Bacteroidota bacterium]|nr:T9SS type A sorting domain-containing protein [Bacteroidota bacterium]